MITLIAWGIAVFGKVEGSLLGLIVVTAILDYQLVDKVLPLVIGGKKDEQ